MNPLQIRRMMAALGTFTASKVVSELLRLYGNKHPKSYLVVRVNKTISIIRASGQIERVKGTVPIEYRWVTPPDTRIEIVEPKERPVDLTDFSHPESDFWKDRSKAAKEDGPQANA